MTESVTDIRTVGYCCVFRFMYEAEDGSMQPAGGVTGVEAPEDATEEILQALVIKDVLPYAGEPLGRPPAPEMEQSVRMLYFSSSPAGSAVHSADADVLPGEQAPRPSWQRITPASLSPDPSFSPGLLPSLDDRDLAPLAEAVRRAPREQLEHLTGKILRHALGYMRTGNDEVFTSLAFGMYAHWRVRCDPEIQKELDNPAGPKPPAPGEKGRDLKDVLVELGLPAPHAELSLGFLISQAAVSRCGHCGKAPGIVCVSPSGDALTGLHVGRFLGLKCTPAEWEKVTRAARRSGGEQDGSQIARVIPREAEEATLAAGGGLS